jgi:hypothetical protein
MTPDPPKVPAIEGSPDEIGAALAAFAGVGVAHLQLVVDPIDERAIGWLAPAIERAKALAVSASS